MRRRLAPDAVALRTVVEIIAAVAPAQWHRLSLFRGEKGPRRYDWTALRLVMWVDEADGEELWLLAWRSIDSPEEIAYLRSNAPQATPVEDIAAVEVQRYTIEQCFEETKSELGMDHYKVRRWPSWDRHITLTMRAAAWLAHMRASHQKTEPDVARRVVGRADNRGRDRALGSQQTMSRSAHRIP